MCLQKYFVKSTFVRYNYLDASQNMYYRCKYKLQKTSYVTLQRRSSNNDLFSFSSGAKYTKCINKSGEEFTWIWEFGCLKFSLMVSRILFLWEFNSRGICANDSHSMNRDTAPRIISPPFPRYKRAFSIAGTTLASAICFSAQVKASKLKTQMIKYAVPTKSRILHP